MAKNYGESNSQTIDHSGENRWLNGIGAMVVLVLVIIAAVWVANSMSTYGVNGWHVLVASSVTAVATGFGAFPLLFVKQLSDRWLGIGNAAAAGLMLGASISLVIEGVTLEDVQQPVLRLLIGMAIGVALVVVAQRLLKDREEEFSIGNVQGANAVQMLMIVGIMTAHSFAEGIGVGVSYGDGQTFRAFISISIAIHNIPEGLAISLILIPRGVGVFKSALANHCQNQFLKIRSIRHDDGSWKRLLVGWPNGVVFALGGARKVKIGWPLCSSLLRFSNLWIGSK